MFKRIVCSSAIKRGASVRLLSKNVAKAASSSTTSYSAATAVPLFAAVPKMLSGQSMIRAFSSQSRLFQEQQTQQQEQQQQQQEQQQQEQQQQEQEQEQQQQQQEDEFSKIQSLDEAISKLRIQKQTIDAQEAKIRDIQAKALRALADSENARRIAKNDIEKAKKYALQDFAKDLLNVADYLAMATKSVTEEQKQDTVVNNLHTGVAMTEKELHKVFNKYGITTIDPMGQQFDPNTMNALFEVDDPSKPGGTVAVVVKTGVILNDRVIRAAQVGVVKERPDEQKPAQKEGEQQQQQQQQQQGENNNQQ